MNEDFLDILRALTAEGARFIVVGAHALAGHGIPRATGDLDIWVEPSAENVAKIWRALIAFGAPVQALGIGPQDFAVPGNVVQLGLPPRRPPDPDHGCRFRFGMDVASRGRHPRHHCADARIRVPDREQTRRRSRAGSRGRRRIDPIPYVPGRLKDAEADDSPKARSVTSSCVGPIAAVVRRSPSRTASRENQLAP